MTETATRSLKALEHDNAQEWARADRRDSLTLLELYRELDACLKPHARDLGYEGLTRMYQYHGTVKGHRLTDQTQLAKVGYRWIAVFAVTGSNEGHYVHVELIWDEERTRHVESLFLTKTFAGHASALELAKIIARILGV